MARHLPAPRDAEGQEGVRGAAPTARTAAASAASPSASFSSFASAPTAGAGRGSEPSPWAAAAGGRPAGNRIGRRSRSRPQSSTWQPAPGARANPAEQAEPGGHRGGPSQGAARRARPARGGALGIKLNFIR